MIKLESVHLFNFLSHAQSSVTLESKGLPTLVIGRNTDSVSCESNGSGKSAIFEAIAWCLYGMTLRGLPSRDVTRGGMGKCSVRIDFSITDEGDRNGDYSVMRHQQDGKFGNSIELSREGESIAAKEKRDTQALIENILGMDFQLFCESTILGQDAMCFANATDAEKKIILERVAQLNKFNGYLAEVVSRRNEYNVTLGELGITLTTLNERKKNLTDEKSRVQQAADQFESRKKERLEVLNGQLEGWERGAQDLEVLKKTLLELSQVPIGESVREKKPDYDEALEMKIQANVGLAKLSQQSLSIEDEQKSLERELLAIKDICPTCERPFDEKSTEAARQTVIGKLKVNKEKAFKLEIDVREADEVVSKAGEKVLTSGEALSKAREEAQVRIESRQQLQGKIESATQAETQARTVRSQIDSEKVARNPDLDRLAKIGVGLEQAEKDRVEAQQKFDILQQDMKYFDFWIKGFGKKGLRGYVLDHVANSLNKYAAKYAEYLTDGEIRVEFSTQRRLESGEMTEDFSVHGINQHGADVYKGNSVGERQRIDMAVALALQDLIRSRMGTGINLFVVDEAAANLDREGSERMLSLLTDMAKEGREVFYVTHDSEMQGLFTQQLEVVKEGGVSRVQA